MENCGCVIFDLKLEEIELILEEWKFEGDLPRELTKVFDSRIVILKARRLIYAVIQVDTWIRTPCDKMKWGFTFSKASYLKGKPHPLSSQLPLESMWLTVEQTRPFERPLINKEDFHEKPSTAPLKLSIAQAAEAVAEKFGVDVDKVRIQVSS